MTRTSDSTLEANVELIRVVDGEDLFVGGLILHTKLELLWKNKDWQFFVLL